MSINKRKAVTPEKVGPKAPATGMSKKEDLSPAEKRGLKVVHIMRAYQVDNDPANMLFGLFGVLTEKLDEDDKERREYKNKKLKLMEEGIEMSRTRLGLIMVATAGVKNEKEKV